MAQASGFDIFTVYFYVSVAQASGLETNDDQLVCASYFHQNDHFLFKFEKFWTFLSNLSDFGENTSTGRCELFSENLKTKFYK